MKSDLKEKAAKVIDELLGSKNVVKKSLALSMLKEALDEDMFEVINRKPPPHVAIDPLAYMRFKIDANTEMIHNLYFRTLACDDRPDKLKKYLDLLLDVGGN